jgi:hypothetical protein
MRVWRRTKSGVAPGLPPQSKTQARLGRLPPKSRRPSFVTALRRAGSLDATHDCASIIWAFSQMGRKSHRSRLPQIFEDFPMKSRKTQFHSKIVLGSWRNFNPASPGYAGQARIFNAKTRRHEGAKRNLTARNTKSTKDASPFFFQRKPRPSVKPIGKTLANFLQKSCCIGTFFMYAQFSVSFLI